MPYIYIQKTKSPSYCCPGFFIHKKITKIKDWTQSSPFCSRCKKSPKVPIEVLREMRDKLLNKINGLQKS